MTAYEQFIKRFSDLTKTRKDQLINTLSNIFTMRLVGNKTHGDLAEIGIVEFINQFMPDYESEHVGKALYRAKMHEEDINVKNKKTGEVISVSLKAYGDGPLQLSTNKDAALYHALEKQGDCITDPKQICEIFQLPAFKEVQNLNVMPLIYREKQKQCNILIFDFSKAVQSTVKIQRIEPNKDANKRKYPVYVFSDTDGQYICEVRYGDAQANALQRGLWTHTKNAEKYFTSATGGWIDYTHNLELITLLKLALNASPLGHKAAVDVLKKDIGRLQTAGEAKSGDLITQGIKYTGSKLAIVGHILSMIAMLPVQTVLDGFSGTTRVSQALAKAGYQVVSADISAWSEVFGKCFLLANKPKSFYQGYIDELNALEGEEGWFTQHYAVEKGEIKKAPFQRKNLRKLDAIRRKIEEYDLDDIDKSVLLTSLIFALDKVDNTIGHYVSYLSEWSPRSYDDLKLEVPDYEIGDKKHTVIKGDIFDVLKGRKFDLAYFDPPYGSNNEKMPPSRVRYAAYYHFWTSVVLYDKPKLFGKVNRREDSRDTIAGSVFEEFKKNDDGKYVATEAIGRLIRETNAKYILFSYSNGGRATKEELYEIMNRYGKLVRVVEIDHKSNVMSTMRWTNEWVKADKKNVEYLFLLEK